MYNKKFIHCKNILTEEPSTEYITNWYLHVVGSTNLSYPPKRSNWKMPILHSIEAKRSFANDRASFGSSSIATNVRDAASPQPPAAQVVSMIIACAPLQGLRIVLSSHRVRSRIVNLGPKGGKYCRCISSPSDRPTIFF